MSRRGGGYNAQQQRQQQKLAAEAMRYQKQTQFWARCLERNDAEASAVVELNRKLRQLRDEIIKDCGEDVLLDLGEGRLRLAPDGRDVLVTASASAVQPPQQPQRPILEDHKDKKQEKKKAKNIKEESDDYRQQPNHLDSLNDHQQRLCVDFLLRRKLRRKLLSRMARRMNRIATSMDNDGDSGSTALANAADGIAIPKYGDLRLFCDQSQVSEFATFKEARDRALLRVLAAKERRQAQTQQNEGEEKATMIGEEEEGGGSKMGQEDDKEKEPDEELKDKMDAPDDEEEQDAPKSLSDPAIPEVPSSSSKNISDKPEEDEDATLPKATEGDDGDSLKAEYALLRDFKDTYERTYSSATTGNAQQDDVQFQILQPQEQDSYKEDYLLLPEGGSGIGAVNRNMSLKEKRQEFRRYEEALLARIPQQPTYADLGLEHRVFYLDERRRKCRQQREREEEEEEKERRRASSKERLKKKEKKKRDLDDKDKDTLESNDEGDDGKLKDATVEKADSGIVKADDDMDVDEEQPEQEVGAKLDSTVIDKDDDDDDNAMDIDDEDAHATTSTGAMATTDESNKGKTEDEDRSLLKPLSVIDGGSKEKNVLLKGDDDDSGDDDAQPKESVAAEKDRPEPEEKKESIPNKTEDSTSSGVVANPKESIFMDETVDPNESFSKKDAADPKNESVVMEDSAADRNELISKEDAAAEPNGSVPKKDTAAPKEDDVDEQNSISNEKQADAPDAEAEDSISKETAAQNDSVSKENAAEPMEVVAEESISKVEVSEPKEVAAEESLVKDATEPNEVAAAKDSISKVEVAEPKEVATEESLVKDAADSKASISMPKEVVAEDSISQEGVVEQRAVASEESLVKDAADSKVSKSMEASAQPEVAEAEESNVKTALAEESISKDAIAETEDSATKEAHEPETKEAITPPSASADRKDEAVVNPKSVSIEAATQRNEALERTEKTAETKLDISENDLTAAANEDKTNAKEGVEESVFEKDASSAPSNEIDATKDSVSAELDDPDTSLANAEYKSKDVDDQKPAAQAKVDDSEMEASQSDKALLVAEADTPASALEDWVVIDREDVPEAERESSTITSDANKIDDKSPGEDVPEAERESSTVISDANKIDDKSPGQVKGESQQTPREDAAATGDDAMDADEKENDNVKDAGLTETDEAEDMEIETQEKDSTSDDSDDDSGEEDKKAEDDDGDHDVEEKDRDEKKADKDDADKQQKEIAPAAPPKIVRPISLAPTPSFYEQDLKRIKLVHADLMSGSIREYAHQRLEDAIKDYNTALRSCLALQDQRNHFQSHMNALLYEQRNQQQAVQNEYAMQLSMVKNRWNASRLQFEHCKLNRVLPSRNGRPRSNGTGYTRTYQSRPDPSGMGLYKTVGDCLGDVVDAVEGIASGMILNERFAEAEPFVPPPPPAGADAGKLQKLKEMQAKKQRDLGAVAARQRSFEDERRKTWKRIMKTKAEFDLPHEYVSNSGVVVRTIQVDMTNYHSVPCPHLNQATMLQVPQHLMSRRSSVACYRPRKRKLPPPFQPDGGGDFVKSANMARSAPKST